MLPSSLSYDSLKSLLAPRDTNSHKGSFGHVLIIGGDAGFGGAAFLAAEAAARTGAGLVSVATHPSHALSYLSNRPELMCRGIEHADQLDALLSKATTLVLGPGLGMSDWSKELFSHVMQSQKKEEKPMVVDADALNLISLGVCSDIINQLSKWVLTPHVGEAGRLLDCNKQEIQHDRDGSVLNIQSKYRGVSILKGSGSLVAYIDDAEAVHLERCSHGNPGMATGGMGDVLSGVIAGLLAQKMPLNDAARLGVCIHALAGDKAAAQDGDRGLLASDLFPWIRRLANPQL